MISLSQGKENETNMARERKSESSNQGTTISNRLAGILINNGKSTGLPTGCRI